ncbi:hypothetical protein, partial [Flavobacterium frigoris]
KIEVPMIKGTVLETIEDCVYLNADNVVSKATIEVVEDGGKVGLSVSGAGYLVDLSLIKNLTAKIPGGANNTNLGKTLFEDAYKIKPTSGTPKTLLDDILAKGDNAIDGVASGSKTEALVDDIFQSQGYTKVDGKYFGDAGSNGFDNVFIKGTIDNPSEIIIIECKQMKQAGNVVLNSPASTGLPAQMSDDWIKYIAREKLKNLGVDKTKLANTILSNQSSFIQKYVVAVDKTAGEVNFLKLGNY